MSNVHHETVKSYGAIDFSPRGDFGGAIGRLVRVALDLLYVWQERAAQRAQLAALTDRELIDMGISRTQQTHEAAKPVWRA